MGFPDLAEGAMWFVALPDRESNSVVSRLAPHAPSRLDHASGRPWLLGHWPVDQLVLGSAGGTRIALLGWSSATGDDLTRLAARTADLTRLDRSLATMAGSHHLVATTADRQRLQGTATGNRRIFHAGLDGAVLAADRADVLAWLVGAELDEQALALRLLDPMPPYPLDDRPMWREVQAVPPDHYVLLSGNGRPRHLRWWACPAPDLPLEPGAVLLREALAEGVATRVRGGGTVSCDLSGGLDSTSVCFLAARGRARLIAYTATGLDPADDDVMWARLAASELPGVEHDVLPREAMPLAYDGMSRAVDRLDEPFAGLLDRAQLMVGLARMAALGSRLHLNGFGGDEVLQAGPEHLHTLIRTRPWLALDRLRGYRALFRWPLRDTVRMLARRRSYADWLVDVAAAVTEPRPSAREPSLDWQAPSRLPPWVTDEAADLVRDAILAAVRADGGPLASGYGRHADLSTIRECGYLNRLDVQLGEAAGLPASAPLLDDAVVSACLAVRAEERATPWRYKPLIVEAMRGIVPARSLQRNTKAEGSAEEAGGLREHRAELLALVEDSRLAALGFVHTDKLRAACRFSTDPSRPHESLQQTLSVEAWLRALSRVRAPIGG